MSMKTYTYIYRADYGSPEVDETTPTITKVEVGKDGKSVRLYVGRLAGRPHPRLLRQGRSLRGRRTAAASAGLLHAELLRHEVKILDAAREGSTLAFGVALKMMAACRSFRQPVRRIPTLRPDYDTPWKEAIRS